MLPKDALEAAFSEWSMIVKPENVLRSPDVCEELGKATFPTKHRLFGVLRPSSKGEVQACVRIAAKYKIPLYPTSRGRNWGLGSMAPTGADSVLLDLRRMDRILDFDSEMATLTVEPGVTFQQAYLFLKEQGSDLFLSTIGGPPDASLIGNAVERGDGIGLYGERAEYIGAMEVLLPTGEFVRTGFGGLRSSKVSGLARVGVGPALDGLFLQSNFGIVTEMTFWLQPQPGWIQFFLCPFPSLEAMAASIAPWRRLLLHQVIPKNCLAFWNGYKLLARDQNFPFEKMQGKTPLPPTDLEGKLPWYAAGASYHPTREHAIETRRVVRAEMGAFDEYLGFFDPASHPEIMEDNGFLGIPSAQNIGSVYWRKKGRPSLEDGYRPEADGCGVLWQCAFLPFRSPDLPTALKLCEDRILEQGFEPNLGLGCTSGRAARLFVALMYDRHVAGDDEKAMATHDAIFEAMVSAGYPPYRLGVQSMHLFPPMEAETAGLLQRLKAFFDPQGLLAPGRYEPPT